MNQLQQLVLGPYLAAQLWNWATFVFGPALVLKRAGAYEPQTLGPSPVAEVLEALGPQLSREHPEPVFLAEQPSNYESVEGFDGCAMLYEGAVQPFSGPIRTELLELMRPHLSVGSRVLDPSSGTGSLAVELAAELPEGEVVAADLSRGMVERSVATAKAAGRTNMAFFQADVGELPPAFEGYFDALMSCLSFHHYPDGEAAARSFRQALRPGGKAFIADGGPQWFIDIAREVSRIADPGFVQHRTGEQFSELLLGAGFREVYWEEALPGIGFTIAST